MGQHKRNPTAIAAKEGRLEPKKTKMDKRAAERLMAATLLAGLMARIERATAKRSWSDGD